MHQHLRSWLAGSVILGLAVGMIYVAGQGQAGENKAIKTEILKIAATLKKGDKAEAKKQAEALAKKVDEIVDVMDLMKPRKKGGLGVGEKVGSIVPDGIELKTITLGRDAPTPAVMAKEAEALEEMAYVMAAIAEVTIAKAPKSNMGKKTVKDWNTWSMDMYEGSLKLAAAAKSKGSQDVKTAASKINNSCNSCHSVFR